MPKIKHHSNNGDNGSNGTARYGETEIADNVGPERKKAGRPKGSTEPNPTTFDIDNRVEDSTYYNLKKMNQLHHEIVRRIVVGQKDHEIAEELGCTRPTVKYTRESPVVKEKLSIMMGARDSTVIEIRDRIQKLTPLALHELEKMMIDDKTSNSVRAKIAQDLLDRAGFDPVKKHVDVGKYDEDKIEEIKQRARENGVIMRSEAEDVEYSNVEDDNA